MEGLHGCRRVLAARRRLLPLGGGEHLRPFPPQRVDDGGDDQPLHIGAWGIMGAEASPLDGIERLFQQGAEDGGLDVAPIVFRRRPQFTDGRFVQRQRTAVLEELAVEPAHLGLDGGREPALVHGPPQILKHGGEDPGIRLTLLEQRLEAVFRQQAHVLGEHGEEDAHEEHGHLLGRVTLLLQCLGHSGQPLRDVARDPCGVPGGIERHGLGPDGLQPLADGGVAQILQIDAEGGTIRELVVGLSVAAEICIDLDAVANVAHQHERWRLMGGGQETDIVFRLPPCVHHQDVPGSVGTATPARLRAGIRRGIRQLLGTGEA